MTVKKIRFNDEKEKEKVKFSREKLLDLSRKKTFKTSFLPNINSIKDEVNNFKKQREKWKKTNTSSNEQIKPKEKFVITSKKTKIKGDNRISKYNSKKFKNPKMKRRKKTKKLNEIEIIVLFEHLSDLLERNRVDKISDILGKTKRKQIAVNDRRRR